MLEQDNLSITFRPFDKINNATEHAKVLFNQMFVAKDQTVQTKLK